MNTLLCRCVFACALLVAVTCSLTGEASAQCATCPTATVAYQPVVAQPTVAYRPYTGWYPGKWLDQWRLRRAGVNTSAPAYTASYTPTYTTGYAPNYTYPTTYTAAYRPYVTSFAPLATPAAAPCNTCTQTVARQVLMRPVVTASPCCEPCSYAVSSGCDACSSGVTQAVYASEPACSSCAASSASSSVVPPSNPNIVGSPTTQPSFTPTPAQPAPGQGSQYLQKPAVGGDDVVPPGEDPLDEFDPPEPAADDNGSSTYYFNAPRLLDPNDRTATRTYRSRKPTVDVRTAVYRGNSDRPAISQTSQRQRTQLEIDSDGWSAAH